MRAADFLLLLSPKASTGLRVTTFTQSLGNELLTNGNFAGWTTDNPNSWTVTGEVGSDPMVTQVDPGGGAGTGAARLFASTATSNPALQQNVLAVASWYEASINLTVRTGGTLNAFDATGAGSISTVTPGVHTTIWRAANAGWVIRSTGAAHDFVVDDASLKLITMNAQQVMKADATTEFDFTLPASPVAGQRVMVRYRKQDDTNYWLAYLQRNDGNTAWDFRLDSVSSGTATNRINVTGVGTPDALKVVTAGNTHTCYTGASGTFTQRGSVITNAAFATATDLDTIYSTGTTPILLTSN